MNARTIRTLAVKDLMEVKQNKGAWMPLLIVPLIFVVLFPVGFTLAPKLMSYIPNLATSQQSMQTYLQYMPEAMKATFAGMNEDQTMIVLFLGYMLAPMFLILPLMFSTVIASESFAGEKERKTLEALLYTPATDAELFLGKVLAAVIPSILVTWVSFLFYILIIDLTSNPIVGRIWFPLPGWYPLILWISPAIAFLGVTFTVLISSRVKSFMEAYQMSGSLVILVLGMLVAQAAGVLYLSVGTGMLIGAVVWLVDLVLVWFCSKTFNRSQIISRIN
jgi:ABC-type Na+ efflux pump permease subunit